MQVVHGLAAVVTRVGDAAEAGLVDTRLLGDNLHCVRDGGKRLGGNVVRDVLVVLLGNHEHVGGRQRVDVREGNNEVILVEEVGANLAVSNLAEETVLHFLLPFLSHVCGIFLPGNGIPLPGKAIPS